MHGWAPLLLSLAFTVGCAQNRRIPETALQALSGADHIEIRTTAKFLKMVHAKWKIRKAADGLRSYAEGWRVPWDGALVPEIIVNFYKGENKLMSFGLGHGFLTTGEGQSWSRPLSEPSRQELLKLLEVQEQVSEKFSS